MENKKQDELNWYELDVKSILEKLQVKPDKGLSEQEVRQRQEDVGKNVLQQPPKASLLQKVLHHLKDVPVIVLLIAVVLSFVLALKEGEGFIEPFVILAVVIMNLVLAITQEGKAEKALEALDKMNAPNATIMRDGRKQNIDTAELVPGDIVILETGSIVPADARLLESIGLFTDEAALTGESEPIEKDAAADLSSNISPENNLSKNIPLGDQFNMVFSGCVVTGGRGIAVVTATGMDTQIGKIAGFLQTNKRTKTPLQKRLDGLGKAICWVAIVSAFILLAVGLRGGADIGSMLMICIALAVAAVPETLSLIVTLSLISSVQKMVKKNALIRKLPAVETLGSASVICSDKTGTLTQNQMAVKQLWMCGGEAFASNTEFSQTQYDFLEMFSMAGNATMKMGESGNREFMGNATEVGILRLLDEKGYCEIAAKDYPRVAEIPFSSDRKMMTVVLEDKGKGYMVLTKGALDRLPICPESIAVHLPTAQRVHDEFADKALRVIALAGKHVDVLPDNEHLEELECDIKLMGLVGLIDPPRPEAAASIEIAEKAGIRTVMITGDHAKTAGAIAKELGILHKGQNVMTGARLAEMEDEELHDTVRNFAVYARVSPEDKIRIVKAWQTNGEVVAMTGDGVNDAPALKAADIGVAMGKTGTEVAKGASDMVLTDDNFATIVKAVGEGRNVYRIVKMVIYFLLVCNLTEVVTMLFGQIVGWGLVLTPVMLLLINILGDGIPGIRLAQEATDPELMKNTPIDKNENLFSGGLLRLILRQVLFCSLVGLIGFYVGNFMEVSDAVLPSLVVGQTMAFLVVGWTSIVHILHVRTTKSIFRSSVRSNMPLFHSLWIMVVVFGLMVAIEPIGYIFGLVPISGTHWLIAIGLSIVPTIMREILTITDRIPFVIERRRQMKEFLANAGKKPKRNYQQP